MIAEYDPFGPTPEGHICSTYNITDPRPGECLHVEERGWRKVRLYCHEHREWHDAADVHDECEACEAERNESRILTEQEARKRFGSGGVCDSHLWEE